MEDKKVTWLELFSDLLFGAAIATVTSVLIRGEQREIPLESIVKFVLIFIPIWWSWVGQTLFTNRFGQDLIHHRFFLILQMLFALVMIASLSTDFDSYFIVSSQNTPPSRNVVSREGYSANPMILPVLIC